MSWGLGWKRPSEIFRLTLNYGTEESREDLNRLSTSSSSCSSLSSLSSPVSPPQDQDSGLRIELDWTGGDDEDQVALRLQSQLMVALPLPQDCVAVDLKSGEGKEEGEEGGNVEVEMKVVKRREPLRGVTMIKAGSGQQNDGVGVLTRLLRSNLATAGAADGSGSGCGEHWRTVTLLNLSGCGLTVGISCPLFNLLVEWYCFYSSYFDFM